jgi:hypothetical protein
MVVESDFYGSKHVHSGSSVLIRVQIVTIGPGYVIGRLISEGSFRIIALLRMMVSSCPYKLSANV